MNTNEQAEKVFNEIVESLLKGLPTLPEVIDE